MDRFCEKTETIGKMSGYSCFKRKREKEHDNLKNWV